MLPRLTRLRPSSYMRHHPKLKGFRPLGGGEDQIFDKPGLTVVILTVVCIFVFLVTDETRRPPPVRMGN